MTVGDRPVTKRRGSRLVYGKSARDASLSGNGTDPAWEENDSHASNYGRVSRINQTRTGPPEEDPDPTHLRSVDGSYAGHRYPKEVPAEAGTSYETDCPGREEVMSPDPEKLMKWCRQN